MANVSKTPDVYYQLRDGAIDSTYSAPTALGLGRSASVNRAAGYRLNFPINAAVSACSISVSLDMPSLIKPFTLRCSLYADELPLDGNTPIATTTVQITQDEQVLAKTFSFSGLSVNADFLTYKIEYTANNWGMSIQSAVTAAATYSVPALSVSPSPATVYDIESSGSGYPNTVTLAFGNRIGQALHVQFKYNSTVVWDFYNIDTDSYSESMAGFFTEAGATGSSITVRVDVSDELGRTANASFTLKQPQTLTPTATAPKSTTVDGMAPFDFTWTTSGDGTQTKAELQWSTDNTNWAALATINSAAQTWGAPAYKFSLGTVYWRVRVTSSLGTVSTSAAVSFTVSYPALSVSPSPATVYDIVSAQPGYPDSVTLSFGNRLDQLLNIKFRYSSTDVWTLENVNSNPYVKDMSGFFEAAGATGRSITVNVSVSDTLGRTASASFSLAKPQGLTATATAPKNTTVDGTLSINFAWSTSGDGTQTKAVLQWSTDNAAWSDLTTVNSAAQTWTAPKLTFPGGTIYWRVRAENNLGAAGDWSSSVSFTARYDAVSQVYPVNSQTSGNFSRTSDMQFQVGLETTGEVPTPFTIASAVFHWRAGTSGEWTDVSMTRADGNLIAYVVIAGGTFPTGQMQWYAEATDNTGRKTETDVYTLTALVSVVDMTPRRPINTVESGSGPIVFEIGFVSLDGRTPPNGEWAYSYNGTDWAEYIWNLANDTGEDYLRLTILANFFSAGTVYWKARAQNSAGVWGDWSQVVSFRVLGAPTVEGVTGDGKPFLTITWQTPTDSDYGQQAYKIEVDGKLYGPYFGANVRSYTLKEPLDDGSHTVRVAAQNRFGLWSEWAEGNIVVTNVPGPAFSVMAVASDPAAAVFMLGATIAPIITRQPQDYQRGTDGNALFQLSNKTWTNFNPANPGYKLIRTWEYKGPNENTWHTIADSTYFMVSVPVTSANNGYQYRGLLSNAVGELYSEPATFYYRDPAGPASELKEGEWKAPTGYFLIYRDGELVGKTYENFFFDMAAIGTVSYEVLQVLPNGYYTRGTVITENVDVTVSAPTLIPLGTTNFLRLTLSEDPRRVQEIRREAEVVYTQYEGTIYPEAEIGEHETLSVSGDCAWTWEERDKAEAFRSYLKKPVIYKTPGGERAVGVLTGYTKKDAHFYRTARFSIQQMDWRDYRDES